MNILHNAELLERLSAEYALGTLRGRARRRFEAWMREHAIVRRAVEQWQDRLNPLAEFASTATPPAYVWDAIEKSLSLNGNQSAGAAKPSFWQTLGGNLNFWRNVSMASTALATLLLVVLLMQQPEPAAPATSFIAMLADDKSQPIAVATGDAQNGQLVVKVLTPQPIAADKSLELWAVPKEGPPRSLGLLAADGSVSLPLPSDAQPDSIPLLAVTLEPKGGSPDPNGPTGPIVFKGAWVRL